MARLFETVFDLVRQAELVRRRRYGVIEVIDAELAAIHLRPWPKLSSVDQVWLGRLAHRRRPGDRCLVYYNQPWRATNYLALALAVSDRDCTFASARRAALVLDQVAWIKRADAIVCDVSNARISDRLLARWGWEPHCPARRHRNYIKRFYGDYGRVELPAALCPVAQLASD